MDVKEQIKKMIIDRLNLHMSIEEFNDDALLFSPKDQGGIGLDSVDALEISVGIMNDFEVEVTDDDFHIFESVNKIAEFIEEKSEA